MLNEPTLEKLKALCLTAFAAAWQAQQQDAALGGLGFDERLGRSSLTQPDRVADPIGRPACHAGSPGRGLSAR